MSKGKYSPVRPNADKGMDIYVYNARKEIPPEYIAGTHFDEELHMANYDAEGFDSYGYSGYDIDGQYVGMGNGIDRLGYTEMDYLMADDEIDL